MQFLQVSPRLYEGRDQVVQLEIYASITRNTVSVMTINMHTMSIQVKKLYHAEH